MLKSLVSGRIDIIYQAPADILYYSEKLGLKDDVELIYTSQESFRLYSTWSAKGLAGKPLGFRKQFQAVLEKLKGEGVIDKIIRRYGAGEYIWSNEP